MEKRRIAFGLKPSYFSPEDFTSPSKDSDDDAGVFSNDEPMHDVDNENSNSDDSVEDDDDDGNDEYDDSEVRFRAENHRHSAHMHLGRRDERRRHLNG